VAQPGHPRPLVPHP